MFGFIFVLTPGILLYFPGFVCLFWRPAPRDQNEEQL